MNSINKIGYLNIDIDKNLDIRNEIKKIKKEKNAIILAHYYQVPEIQDIADFIGDSYALSKKAQENDAELIVFAGVHFMAETAKILNPDKKVVLPDLTAGCSLADSCKPEDLKEFLKSYPNHLVISYINCSAEVKAMSDIICTSGNAVKIIEKIPKDQKIVFCPDKNLGSYINNITGRNMVLWNGTCEVHDILTVERVLNLKKENPGAKIIAHPECKATILEIADFIGSTTALLNYTKTNESNKFIVATETGIIHQMKKESPEKEFIIVSNDETCSCNDCPHMKKNTLEKLYICMKYEQPEIILPEELMDKARIPVLKMLELSK
ncbi:MAG TPA: quinolinate synthase NadA [Bacteroidales bacterium]|nr:quinolinate synthase NadA [Bacteroidales bacterium]HPS16624.1 quinolinate synthase NadA [Bacteroidales bacterium]